VRLLDLRKQWDKRKTNQLDHRTHGAYAVGIRHSTQHVHTRDVPKAISFKNCGWPTVWGQTSPVSPLYVCCGVMRWTSPWHSETIWPYETMEGRLLGKAVCQSHVDFVCISQLSIACRHLHMLHMTHALWFTHELSTPWAESPRTGLIHISVAAPLSAKLPTSVAGVICGDALGWLHCALNVL